MSRFIQIHALTVYAPSNLNRDDTGRPKTAKFGAAERLRISSQALKRAIRTSEAFRVRVGANRGERTQRMGDEIRKHLVAKGMGEAEATKGARSIAAIFGKLKDEKSTDKSARDTSTYIEQLAFVAPEERTAALALADQLADGEALPADAEKLVAAVLRHSDSAADVAMFGRMLADHPEFNREAAVQVAHAITTHRVEVEDDFYTAVDDLKKKSEDAGAGFIGELGFGSGVFYLYACIDRDQLEKNLGGNTDLAAIAIAALVEGLATASPTGKQASFASRSRASWLRIEKGGQQPRQLSAAFFRPIRPSGQSDDLLALSVEAIEAHAASMNRAYGACYDGEPCTMDVVRGVGTLADALAFAAG